MLSTKQLFQLQKRLPKWCQRLFVCFFFFRNGQPFLSKSSKFCVVPITRFCSNFASKWYLYLLRNVWRDLQLPMSASAMFNLLRNVYGETLDFLCQCHQQHIKYPIGTSSFAVKLFRVTVADTDIGSLKSL